MNNDNHTPPAGIRRMARWAVLAAGLALAALYAMQARQGKPPAPAPAEQAQRQAAGQGALPVSLASGAMQKLVIHPVPKPLPEFTVLDRDGKPRRLAEWRGKVVLVNFWASWCPPCRKEMPEIVALQEAFAGKDFVVVAISEDYKGYDWAFQALKMMGAQRLTLLWDKGNAALRALNERGLPVTLLLNREGLEVARLVGPAAWNAPEAQAVIKTLLAQK